MTTALKQAAQHGAAPDGRRCHRERPRVSADLSQRNNVHSNRGSQSESRNEKFWLGRTEDSA